MGIIVNAFGTGSPSWNLAFPTGNMTAAEIIAYLPHWLKSIDVIDRFVTNGALPSTIAALVREFRYQPTVNGFSGNSAQIMMTQAMHRAGYENWTPSTHRRWPRRTALSGDNLSVSDFRPPRLTHPNVREVLNSEADQVAFKDLALHIKEHPFGDDALDLTRCVQYALEHVNEKWLFPVDYERLVIHLGGPARVTHFQHDREIFGRRGRVPPSTAISTSRMSGHNAEGKAIVSLNTMSDTRIGRALSSALSSRSATPLGISPRKRLGEGLGKVLLGSTRRSGRLVDKADVDFCDGSEVDTTDLDVLDTPNKKRKLSRVPRTSKSSNDSDFVQDDSEPDDDVVETDDISEQEIKEAAPKSKRAAAHKARDIIQASYVRNRTPLAVEVPNTQDSPEKPLKALPRKAAYMSAVISPDVMQAAAQFSKRKNVYLKPPILSANRLKVDSSSIWLYAAEGCTTMAGMWETALSSSRFGGPRRHSPFRELHRLTTPDNRDTSDWAENIRWAKEQHKLFGSATWTEYDYHLECITEHRREVLWISEETIVAGMRTA